MFVVCLVVPRLLQVFVLIFDAMFQFHWLLAGLDKACVKHAGVPAEARLPYQMVLSHGQTDLQCRK